MKLFRTSHRIRQWSIFVIVNLMIIAYFGYALIAPASMIKSSLLPGSTSHGHHQIELDCDACHSPTFDGAKHTAETVMQDACIRCHGEQLKRSRDTHPARKFNDPTNAELLLTLDAQNCLTCHREHVPAQTSAMGLTIPKDYCWHCHQEVAESRPSHQGLAYDSCGTAGCHNYHDNRALYEKFLGEHFAEPDLLQTAVNPQRNLASNDSNEHADSTSLHREDSDAPREHAANAAILDDWAETAHAAAGVNCRDCHAQTENESWSDRVGMDTCDQCHSAQTKTFLAGRHGMRLAQAMSPLTPEMARLPMHVDATHRQMNCNSCHADHRFDTRFAAVDACQQCHADAHSNAYIDSSHADLWQQELAGEIPQGSGVSCATCHLPRLRDGKSIWVNHDQNANLRPNETMAKEVCGNCHGLEFSLSSLADPSLVKRCFDESPSSRTKSVAMAHHWFESKAKAKQQRERSKP